MIIQYTSILVAHHTHVIVIAITGIMEMTTGERVGIAGAMPVTIVTVTIISISKTSIIPVGFNNMHE